MLKYLITCSIPLKIGVLALTGLPLFSSTTTSYKERVLTTSVGCSTGAGAGASFLPSLPLMLSPKFLTSKVGAGAASLLNK